MYYGVYMYKCYVIPIGTMSVCWGNSKKLTAGARMLTADPIAYLAKYSNIGNDPSILLKPIIICDNNGSRT